MSNLHLAEQYANDKDDGGCGNISEQVGPGTIHSGIVDKAGQQKYDPDVQHHSTNDHPPGDIKNLC